MKKILFVFMVSILVTTISYAQNRGGQRNFDPEEIAKRQTEELKETLDLKKDQEKKVYELNLKNGKKMAEMRQNSDGDREAMRASFMKLREEQNKEMKKILSDTQYKKYEKYLEERRNRRGGGQGRR